MELHDKDSERSEISIKALWILTAISLSALEMLLPRLPLFPWLKPGLANIITIMWIIRYGTRDAVLFSFIRSWIISFYFGFSFTSFLLSTTGGIFSSLMMGIAWSVSGKRNIFGTIGIGMIGAIAHNTGQISIIYLTMARNSFIFYQLPLMCAASIISGAIVGSAVPFFTRLLSLEKPIRLTASVYMQNNYHNTTDVKNVLPGILIFFFCIYIIIIRNSSFLVFSAIAVSIAVQIITGFSIKKFLHPLKFWPLFLFIAIAYMLFSFGTRIHGLPLITIEGLNETTLQFLKLWIWLEASLLLTHFRFHIFFFSMLTKLFPSAGTIFRAGLIALEYFPEMVQFSKSRESMNGLNFFRTPKRSLEVYIKRQIDKIDSFF